MKCYDLRSCSQLFSLTMVEKVTVGAGEALGSDWPGGDGCGSGAENQTSRTEDNRE